MPEERVVTEAQLRADNSFTEGVGRIRKARPDWDSMKKDPVLGPALTITDTPDGKRNGRVVGKAALKRLLEMTRESKRMEVEFHGERQAKIPTVRLRCPDGSEERVQEHLADRAARKRGLRPVRCGRPRTRTVIQRDGTHLVYIAEPGGQLELVRAYRLVDNGDRTSREVEVSIG